MNRFEEHAHRVRTADRIALLESHQDGRRERLATIQEVIDRKQIEIDNLRNQLQPPSQRAVELWGCEEAVAGQ